MLDASPCSALTVNPVCFQITGMSLKKKSQECAKLMESEQWGELSRDSVGSLDRILIKPAAQGYRWAVPEFGRNRMRNFLDNLGEPVIFINEEESPGLKKGGAAKATFCATTGLWPVFFSR